MDSINRVLAKRELEPLTLMTLGEWQTQQEGAGGSASMAGLASLGLMMGF